MSLGCPTLPPSPSLSSQRKTPPFPAFRSHSCSEFTFSTPFSLHQHHLLNHLSSPLCCPWLSICFHLFPLLSLLLFFSFGISLHITPYPPFLPLSFPACSSRPVEAGGSPEPSTHSRGPPTQPGWLAGSLAHLQTHTIFFLLCLLSCFQPFLPFHHFFFFSFHIVTLNSVMHDLHLCCSFHADCLPPFFLD